MKLIVGLGNPGLEYEKTRHNVGFEVVNRSGVLSWKKSEKLEAEVAKIDDLILAKPMTFMNNSGRAVRKLVDFYKLDMSDLWVIHDDLDIPLGEYKIQMGVGPKIHNGVVSVEESLGTNDFWRVRIGVDNRGGSREIRGEDYVLGKFKEDEKSVIERVIGEVVTEILEAVKG
jgi:peptidyl-tRNA hydrolase, PTH1 family